MNDSGPAPEHQVSEQEVIALFSQWIHVDVEIRRIDAQTLLLLNRMTGATLTFIAEAAPPEHTYAHSFWDGHECPGCHWEWIDPPPVKLSLRRGNR